MTKKISKNVSKDVAAAVAAAKGKPEAAKVEAKKPAKPAKVKKTKKTKKVDEVEHKPVIKGFGDYESTRLDPKAKRKFTPAESKLAYAKDMDLVAVLCRLDGTFEIYEHEGDAYLFNLSLSEPELKRVSKLLPGHDYANAAELVSVHHAGDYAQAAWFPALCDATLYTQSIDRAFEKAHAAGKVDVVEDKKAKKWKAA